MDNNEIKITTGMGSGMDKGIPAAPVNLPTGQPDFLGSDGVTPEAMGSSPIPPGVQKHGGPLRTVLMVLVGLIFVGGVGALGYFVIYPMIFPVKTSVVTAPPVNTSPAVTLAPHISYLVKLADAVAKVTLSDENYSTIASALQNESFNQLADGKYKEVKISDSKGQVVFDNFFYGIAGQPVQGDTAFEQDFTALFYYDAAGVWPIYVAKLQSGTKPENVMGWFKQTFEPRLALGNFFISSPGKFTSFKDGKIGNYSTRYNLASQAGAAFNYGVFGNYFIISTSYTGLKNALPLLGL